MRKDVMEFLADQKELRQFIREQPYWYRKLSRNPNDYQSLQIASINYYKKTIPHQVEKFSNSVQMASMMFNMFQAMNSQQ
jgi:hypothetical protein